MSELVSVIINVYNCKEYLPISLESVRQQTYKNLEVILVDDASTDGSGEFCDYYCKLDERFRVIHHEKNTGVSGPRNTGLKNAHGEYIYFLDGDDYIHERAIEKLLEAIDKTGLELAVFDHVKTSSLNEDTKYKLKDIKPEIVSSERIIYEMLFRKETFERSRRWCVVWNKLYSRSLIKGLFFNDYYSIQDQDFNLRVYLRIGKAVFIPEPLYWYYKNPNSLQRTNSLVPKKLYFNTMYRFRMLDYLSKKDKVEQKYRAWVLDYGYREMLGRRDFEKGTEYESRFEEIGREILKSTRKEFIKSPYIRFEKKIRFLFYWYCPKLAKVYVRTFYGKKSV